MRLVGRSIGGLFRGISLLWQVFICGLLNLRRSLSPSSRADYVQFEISGSLLERTPQQPWYFSFLPFSRPGLTFETLHHAMRQTAADPNVSGVLFLVKGVQLSLAQAQSLTDICQRFRHWDREFHPNAPAKEVVVFLETCSNAEYVMAAAADRIFMPRLTDWSVVGLRTEPVFLADMLHRLGVQAEVVKVAPWKTAYDNLERSEISPAHRKQFEWLLDSWYEDIVTPISKGRSLSEEQTRSAINRAPLTADEAKDLRLIDGFAYEDQLPMVLALANRDARILSFERARPTLYRRPRRRHRKSIGVISLSGAITSGKSRRFPGNLPLLGNSTVGSTTVQHLVRAGLEDDRLAGILLHIDSSGGSALASDLIWRELTLLSRKKPLVAYLGDIAASGGYYVALPAQRIVCQPATLTGSIGVITAKLVTSEAFTKIGVNRFSMQRGQNADIYSDSHPWREEQRDRIKEYVHYSYHNFRERVADARQLSFESLDPICGGRVWTGRQAHVHRLVDELGDFARAIDILCELADLPQDGSVPIRQVIADQPKTSRSKRSLGAGHDLAELTNTLLTILQGDVSSLLGQDRIWLLADGLPKTKPQ